MDKDMDPIEVKLKALSLRGGDQTKDDKTCCPPDETFGAFMDDQLSGEESNSVKSHIASCPRCHMAYSAWIEVAGIEGPPVPAKLLESARAMVKPPITRVAVEMLKKAFHLLNPHELEIAGEPQPGMAGARRGGSDGSKHEYEVLDIKSTLPHLETIRIQHLEDAQALKLSLIPSPGLEKGLMKRIRIDLYRETDLLQSWPLYMEGTSLNPLERGVYKVNLSEVSTSLEKHRIRPLGSMELNLT